ncbi:MAG TPA: DUF6541 family protein, partial [Candidatus Eisenbacteria bacterium]|nr:DUF6541 family protein [Candidatus Eisenbacteria bacterium]
PLGFGLAAIGLHLALGAGALAGLPATARVLLALVGRVLGPGATIAALLEPPAWWLVPAWGLGFGVAWNAALVLATRAVGAPFTVLIHGAVAADLLLWALALVRVAPWRAASAAVIEPRAFRLGRGAGVAVLLAMLAAGVFAGRVGVAITWYSDSPDHIATIRRMLEHGDAFPSDAFYRDAGESGVDPRKALWHPQVALVSGLAAADPIDTWRRLPALLSPLFALNVAALGWLLAGGAGAAVGAWSWFLTYGGGLASQPIRETVFSTKLADQLALATTVALLWDLARRSRRARATAVLLGLSAALVHVFAAIQFALAFGALGVGLLVRERGFGERARRLLATGLWMAAAMLPWLLWRAHGAYRPVNPIHTEPQGLLTLWDDARIVGIGILWEWMGRLWVLVPLAAWGLWRAARRNDAALYVLAVSLVVALVIFDPPVVHALQPTLGYLLMRMIWMVPLFGVLAWGLPALARRLARGPRTPATIAGAAITVALLVPMLRESARLFVRPDELQRDEAAMSPLQWRRGLSWMARHLPPDQVVLSDPGTSYAIPMATSNYVMTLVDQHSSPNDARALDRLLDARDALDPYASWERTRQVIDRYGVTVVVVNARFPDVPHFDYWAPSAEWAADARARLDRAPQAFERVYDDAGFTVYRVHRAALAALSGAVPRPFVDRYDPRTATVARRMGDDRPALQWAMLWPATAAPGDTLHGVFAWRALRPLAPGSYDVAVRFDRPLPDGMAPPAWLAKPVRKVIERVRHERYRFRADHLPVAGDYGVDLWRPDQVVRDSFQLVVPADAAPGRYVAQVRMLRQPHYPNLRLSDYFFERDYFAGVPIGGVTIAPRHGS